MQIANFNGFNFHCEIFGYIIFYFICKKHNLTIYCRLNDSNGFVELYNEMFKDSSDWFEFKPVEYFEHEKYNYDAIVLTTDDDPYFSTNDEQINNRTIRIDHDYLIRRPIISKYIATRPFEQNYRNWAIPCYPIITKESKQNEIHNAENINIVILGSDYGQYNMQVLNRLCSHKLGCKIVIHAVSASIEYTNFQGLSPDIELILYKNWSTMQIFQLITNSDFVITDIAQKREDNGEITPITYYENERMSGVIPIAISLLTPIIISKQANKYYQFRNVIEFDKHSCDDIVLTDIDFDLLEKERNELINMFFMHMDNLLLR